MIKKQEIDGKIHYFFTHSYKEGKRLKVFNHKLGTTLPSDNILQKKKEEFIRNIVSERWGSQTKKIRKGYREKFQNSSKSLKKKRLEVFGVRFTYESNKIEGSSLTLKEVAKILFESDVGIDKPENDLNEARYHMKCYRNMITTNLDLSLDLARKWHKLLFEMHPNRNNLAGVIRKDPIYISGSDFVPPITPQPLLDDLFEWYNENKDSFNPIILACLMHYHFVSMHPFNDGNGRISRLLMNYILFNNDYPMFNIKAKKRFSYYNSLEDANLQQDEMRFVEWFFN
jgi:Fic family protein